MSIYTKSEDEPEPYIVDEEYIASLEELPEIEAEENVTNDDLYRNDAECVPETATITMVLALPSPQTSVQLFLLNQERKPSPLYKPVASRITAGPAYETRPLLADDWYVLAEEFAEKNPHLILFPYDAQMNARFVDTMAVPQKYRRSGRRPFQNAGDVCAYIYGRKKQEKDFPWLYLFGEEKLPDRFLWDCGIKKMFSTNDPLALAGHLSAAAHEAFHAQQAEIRNAYFRR